MSAEIKVIRVANPEQLEQTYAIRREVFIGEQACPPDMEWEYEDESTHFLATLNGEPAGVARWRKTENGYKLERFAVLQPYRGKGVAQALVKAVLADLPPGAGYIYLNAQVQAMPLYAKFGFEKIGPMFDEVGIWHYKMVKASEKRGVELKG